VHFDKDHRRFSKDKGIKIDKGQVKWIGYGPHGKKLYTELLQIQQIVLKYYRSYDKVFIIVQHILEISHKLLVPKAPRRSN